MNVAVIHLDLPMWTCKQCETQIADQFDACWNCGTDIEGRVEPEFRHADDSSPVLPVAKLQFGLAELFLISNAIVFVIAGWKTQNPTLLSIGFLVLALAAACWLLPNQFHKWQRRHRQSKENDLIDN